jgi:hypothetical protein
MIYKTSLFPASCNDSALVSSGINTAADFQTPAYNYFFSGGRFHVHGDSTTTLNGVTKQSG